MLRRSTAISAATSAAALVASILVGGPALADDPVEPKLPAAKANKNTQKGDPSAVGEAIEKATETKKPVEILAERDAYRTLTANPDGTLTQDVSQSPRFAKTDDGSFEKIDPNLERSEGRLEPKVASQDTTFSATGAGELSRLSLGEGRSVTMSFDGDLGQPEVDGPLATYPVEDGSADASETSVVAGPRSRGFLIHVQLDKTPSEAPEYRFPFTTEGVTPVLDGQVLKLKDGDKVVAQSQPLRMWDSAVDDAGEPSQLADVDAALEKTDAGYTLVLKPSMKWLQAENRQYPVTVDPDLAVTSILGDTYIFSDQTSSETRSTTVDLRVGSNDGTRQFRSILWFRYNKFVGTDVTKATLKLKQFDSATGCTDQPTTFAPTVSGDKAAASVWWGNKPAPSTDARWRSSKSFNNNQTSSTCPTAVESIDVTPMVNAWSGKHAGAGEYDNTWNRQSIQLLGGTTTTQEKDANRYKRFCSEDWVSSSTNCATSNVVPTLSVTIEPDLGAQSWYSTTDHPFNDHSSLSVNNRNGNVVVSAQDGKMNGVGPDLQIARTYNSQATVAGTSLGEGWNLGIGPDIWLDKINTNGYRYDYHGPSGTVLGSFVRKSATTTDADYKKFTTPIGGVGAELEETTNGFTLTFKKSRQKFEFNNVDSGGDAYLTKIRDRSDNEITFDYSGTTPNGRPKLTSMTDSGGHTLNVTYSGSTITAITEASNYTEHGSGTPRSWQYGYTSGRLTSQTDPEGKVTSYTYNGSGLLSKITGPARTSPDPSNPTGPQKDTTSETELTYSTTGNAARVGNVRYRYDLGASTATWYNYAWDYAQSPKPACDGNGTISTAVTDPNNNTTTYCYTERNDTNGDFKTWVYDATGKRKSQDYSADNAPQTFTDSNGATTVNTYSGGGLQDRLEKVAEPKNSTDENSATTGLSYDTSSTSVEGGAYLPSALRSSTGDCNKYGYDSKGRTTTAYQGITPTASTSSSLGECPTGSTTTGGSKFEREYNDNGTVKKSWDGNSGDSPTDAEKTVYDYWQAGQTGYVAGSAGQLKSVRKPGGDCSTGSSRKLCTSYTYDGAARVKTMTDGRGKLTSYQYDRNDRVLKVIYDNNDLACLLGATLCINYTYDVEGNVTLRGINGANRSTTFYYDRMNRTNAQTVQTSAINSLDFVTNGYDGVGNLVYRQTYLTGAPAAHVAIYYYNAANRPTGINNNGDTIEIGTDGDGRTTSIKYPATTGSAGAKLSYDYTKSGRPKTMKWLNHAGTTRAQIEYNYQRTATISGVTIKYDTPQMQKRTLTGAGADSTETGTISYDYTKQRLTKATNTNGPNYEYDYDKIGNLSKEIAGSTTTHFGYNRAGILCWRGTNAGASGDKLATSCPTTPSGNTTINSDTAGNSLGTTTNPLTVNDANQVTSIDGDTQVYLDQGNDLRQDSGSNRELDAGQGVIGVKRGSSYEYYLRDSAGTILARTVGTTATYYASEPNGNIVWLFDNTGTRVASYKYAPYGDTNAIGGTTADNNRFRWLGAQQNGTTNSTHYKLGARYYDRQGHFTQPDPIAGGMANPRTLTSYGYGWGDPINNFDPTGLDPSCQIGAGFVGGLTFAVTEHPLFATSAAGFTREGCQAGNAGASGSETLQAGARGFYQPYVDTVVGAANAFLGIFGTDVDGVVDGIKGLF